MKHDKALLSGSVIVQTVATLAVIFVCIDQTKPIFELDREIDKSNTCMKYGRNRVTNDLVIPSTCTNRQAVAILAVIFVSVHYCFGNFREGFVFAKLRLCKVS